MLLIGWMIGGCVDAVPFETIEQGVDSGYRDRTAIVVRTPEEWRQVWERHAAPRAPHPERPAVDFHREMVIAVFLGAQPTGGFTIEVKRIEQRVDGVHVVIEETAPPQDAMVTQAFTSPYHLVRIRRLDRSVIFELSQAQASP
jgi:hypothetical protein